MKGEARNNADPVLHTWDPGSLLRKISTAEVKWSRGFLRSRPERWFPGFAAQWWPLTHSLGLEVKVSEIKTAISAPAEAALSFVGTVDDEPVAVRFDQAASLAISEAVSPGANEPARGIVLEYIARRILGSLALSWAGPQSSVVRFDTELKASSLKEVGAVRLQLNINGNLATVWISLGQTIVDRLDGLWRRQLHSTVRTSGVERVNIEVAQLAVPPAMLGDYTRPGTVIDLEIPVSEKVGLRIGERPWLQAKLFAVDGRFGIETLPGVAPLPAIPEGSTRLVVAFDAISLDANLMAELAQSGAMYSTNLALSPEVQLQVRGEEVARGTLCTYEGRFAVSVS